MIRNDADTLHILSVDLPMNDAEALARDGARLGAALGGVQVDPDRVHALDPRVLMDLGLAHYLVEGEGADPDSVRATEVTLAELKGPLLILRPRAVTGQFQPEPPLSHVGAYRMARARPEGAPLHVASAGRTPVEEPVIAPAPENRDRRQSGVVATVAILVALMIAFVMWFLAI